MSEHTDRLSISGVAVALKVRYQRARDLVLSGELGEVETQETPRSIRYFVHKKNVDRYRKEGKR